MSKTEDKKRKAAEAAAKREAETSVFSVSDEISAFEEVKKFISACVNAGIKVSTSIVTGFDKNTEINIENCEKISKELGANFRNREFITNGY